MSELSRAITSREIQVTKLQGEIEVLSRAESILARAGRDKNAAAPKAKVKRKGQKMSAAQKKAVSARMKAYWAKRRKKKTAGKSGK